MHGGDEAKSNIGGIKESSLSLIKNIKEVKLMKTSVSKFKVFFIALCLALCYTFVSTYSVPPSAYAQTTVQSNGLENGGIYKLQNVYTGLYLDVANAATDNGTQLLQWYDWDTNNQKFVLKLINGKWKIYPLHAESLNRVLDIPWASADDNVQVALYDEFDSEAQGFQFNYQYGNVYTITTQPSNYTKYLGIQNNSQDLSAFLVQTSNITSAYWRLVKVGPSVEGITINNGEAYPAPSSHYVLGDCIYVGDGVIQGKRVTKQNDKNNINSNNNETENYDKYYIRYYRYEKALNAKVDEIGSVTIQPNQSATYTISQLYTYSKTKGTTASLGFERALSVGGTVGLNIWNFKVGLECDETIKTSIESTYSYSETHTVTAEQGTTIASGINNSSSPKTYICETRSIYNCYVAQIYEIGYTETTEDGGWWLWDYTMHYYSPTGINLGVGEQQFLDSIQLSIYLTPYVYDSNTGLLLYDGAQETNVVYV